MSLAFKFGSLAIRTLAKPLSNSIKRNAANHERFRRICVAFAQRLHRVDMHLRLGLLQDPAVIERQIQRELKEAEKKRQKDAAPTVKTEAETLADEQLSKKERKEVEDHVKAAHKPPRIRPLSESKAIETGANFISETFLFTVAAALLLAESWRRDRKEKKADQDVSDALKEAERERRDMRIKLELLQEEIEALMDKKPFEGAREAARKGISSFPVATIKSDDEIVGAESAPAVTQKAVREEARQTMDSTKGQRPSSSTSPDQPNETKTGPSGKRTQTSKFEDSSSTTKPGENGGAPLTSKISSLLPSGWAQKKSDDS